MTLTDKQFLKFIDNVDATARLQRPRLRADGTLDIDFRSQTMPPEVGGLLTNLREAFGPLGNRGAVDGVVSSLVQLLTQDGVLGDDKEVINYFASVPYDLSRTTDWDHENGPDPKPSALTRLGRKLLRAARAQKAIPRRAREKLTEEAKAEKRRKRKADLAAAIAAAPLPSGDDEDELMAVLGADLSAEDLTRLSKSANKRRR